MTQLGLASRSKNEVLHIYSTNDFLEAYMYIESCSVNRNITFGPVLKKITLQLVRLTCDGHYILGITVL